MAIQVYRGTSTADGPVETLTATRSGDSYSVDASSALPDGAYTAQAEQSDEAGNGAKSATRTFRIETSPDHRSVRDSRAPAVRASRACSSRTLRARVRVDEPVQSVVVILNGRRLLRTARASFSVRVAARRLRRGRVHRLTVMATDAAGNRTRRTFRLRACRAQRPRFTG